MKSTNKYAFMLQCTCEDPLHSLIVEVYPQGPNEKQFKAFVYLAGNMYASWYIRLKLAFLYLIRPNPYRFGNVVVLSEKNTDVIISLGKALEEIKAMSS